MKAAFFPLAKECLLGYAATTGGMCTHAHTHTHLSFDEEADMVLCYGAAIQRGTVVYHLHHHQVQCTGQHPQGTGKVPSVSQLDLISTKLALLA